MAGADVERGRSRTTIAAVGARRELQLTVNFNPLLVVLQKETRNLQWLKFRVPFNVQLTSTTVQSIYPQATSLNDSVRTYAQTCMRVTERIRPLVAKQHAEVQKAIEDGIMVKWESHRLDAYVRFLGDAVLKFEDTVGEVLEVVADIDAHVAQLESCDLTSDALGEQLAAIQRLIDDLSLKSSANMTCVPCAFNALVYVVC